MTGYVCSYAGYEYKGHAFEMTYSGPWPLRKDGDPWRRNPTKAFWDMIDEWESLPDDEKAKTRVGGGCVRSDGKMYLRHENETRR